MFLAPWSRSRFKKKELEPLKKIEPEPREKNGEPEAEKLVGSPALVISLHRINLRTQCIGRGQF